MASNNSMKVLAVKLNLYNHEHVLNKAAENLRLLNAKSTAGSNMTDTSKVVICLDLAATMLGTHVDQKLAVRYSGLKAPSYYNCKKVVENLLELNSEQLSVAALCVTLQCSGAQSLAQTMLDEYQKVSATFDPTLPQYACVAVYHACRMDKIKIAKKLIIEKSKLKAAQWTKLDSDFSHFVKEKFASRKNKCRDDHNTETNNDKSYLTIEKSALSRVNVAVTKRLNSSSVLKFCNKGKVPNDSMEKVVAHNKEEKSDNKIELYENWRTRMLFDAYDELKQLEKTERPKGNICGSSPRRSPRKTPQKYSPYASNKSPKKNSGIRLLFP